LIGLATTGLSSVLGLAASFLGAAFWAAVVVVFSSSSSAKTANIPFPDAIFI
jgi:hypothetical protein